jgi:hypothetical protein
MISNNAAGVTSVKTTAETGVAGAAPVMLGRCSCWRCGELSCCSCLARHGSVDACYCCIMAVWSCAGALHTAL